MALRSGGLGTGSSPGGFNSAHMNEVSPLLEEDEGSCLIPPGEDVATMCHLGSREQAFTH